GSQNKSSNDEGYGNQTKSSNNQSYGSQNKSSNDEGYGNQTKSSNNQGYGSQNKSSNDEGYGNQTKSSNNQSYGSQNKSSNDEGYGNQTKSSNNKSYGNQSQSSYGVQGSAELNDNSYEDESSGSRGFFSSKPKPAAGTKPQQPGMSNAPGQGYNSSPANQGYNSPTANQGNKTGQSNSNTEQKSDWKKTAGIAAGALAAAAGIGGAIYGGENRTSVKYKEISGRPDNGIVRNCQKFYLRHESTGKYLGYNNGQISSQSRQQLACAKNNRDNTCEWVIVPVNGDRTPSGDPLVYGTQVRLFNLSNKTYIHSHATFKSEKSNQGEVTTFGSDDLSDTNDHWIAERYNDFAHSQPWSCDGAVMFKHTNTSGYLHSHDVRYDNGEQEVTTYYDANDGNNKWIMEF
ncbi:Stromal cell-derived factor 2-like protein, partial [Smittium culicis]